MELTVEIKNYDELTDETKEALKNVEFEIIVNELEDEDKETEEVINKHEKKIKSTN